MKLVLPMGDSDVATPKYDIRPNFLVSFNPLGSGGLYMHFFGVMFGGHAVNGLKVPKWSQT